MADRGYIRSTGEWADAQAIDLSPAGGSLVAADLTSGVATSDVVEVDRGVARLTIDVTRLSGTGPEVTAKIQTRKDSSDSWRDVGTAFTKAASITSQRLTIAGLDREVRAHFTCDSSPAAGAGPIVESGDLVNATIAGTAPATLTDVVIRTAVAGTVGGGATVETSIDGGVTFAETPVAADGSTPSAIAGTSLTVVFAAGDIAEGDTWSFTAGPYAVEFTLAGEVV